MTRTATTARRSRKARAEIAADANDTVALALAEAPAKRRGRKAPAVVTETALDRAEIAERLEATTKTAGKFDRPKAIAFAEANGIKLHWSNLDNGRTAMNIRNMIRSRALHGERVVWG